MRTTDGSRLKLLRRSNRKHPDMRRNTDVDAPGEKNVTGKNMALWPLFLNSLRVRYAME